MKIAKAILAGVASLAVMCNVAKAAGSTMGHNAAVHVITVKLPGGGIERIRYWGNDAPEVVVLNDGRPTLNDRLFLPDPGFAEFNRITAQMDELEASVEKRMERIFAAGQDPFATMRDINGPIAASFGQGPAGGYSYVSGFTMEGACTRMVKITQRAGDTKPRVVTQTSGDCKARPGTANIEENAESNDGVTPISARVPVQRSPRRQTL